MSGIYSKILSICSVIHIKGFLKSSKQHPYVLLTLPTPLYLLDHTAHKTENLRPIAEPFLILLLLLLSRFSCARLCATPETAAHQAPVPGILQARIALAICTFVGKVISLLSNMPQSRFVIAFLPKSNGLLTCWLQSPSTVI